MHLTDYSFKQYLDSLPKIYKTQDGYIDFDNLNIKQECLGEIICSIDKTFEDTDYVSIDKIFNEKIVTCQMMNIDSSLLLYNYLKDECNEYNFERYPTVTKKSAETKENANRLVHIIDDYFKSKKRYFSIFEIREYFVDDLGYSMNSIKNYIYKNENIINYLENVFIHVESISWSEEKQNNLEENALYIYNEALKNNIIFGSIKDLVEIKTLPKLSNELMWTETLIYGLLLRSEKFILLGNTKNIFVPSINKNSISNLSDLVYYILKDSYNGAANLKELERDLRHQEIIKNKLTKNVIVEQDKVKIIGNEIIISELVSDA